MLTEQTEGAPLRDIRSCDVGIASDPLEFPTQLPEANTKMAIK